MIAILDYQMGNVGSIANMLKKIGEDACIASDRSILSRSRAIILPGVGAFDKGMEHLEERGLIQLLNDLVIEQKKPLLGICLGMQLLTEGSEEGQRPGLGWIKARTKRFSFPDRRLRVPHMGWNAIRPRRGNHLLDEDPTDPARFYFVHSYHVVCENEDDILCETDYGGWFTSGLARDHIIGLQFHPEKSHRYGMATLERFAQMLTASRQESAS